MRKNKSVKLKKSPVWAEYVVLNILVLIAITLVMQLWKTNILVYPLSTASDANQVLYILQQLKEAGLFGFSERVSYPYYAYMSDFPALGMVSNFFRWVLLCVTGDTVVTFNFLILSGFFSAATTSYFVLRKLKISRGAAMMAAILYSFLPYHFWRNIAGHLAYGAYWSIPLFLYFCISYMKGITGYYKGKKKGKWAWVNKDNALHIITLILLGGHCIYYTYFACFFLCMLILYSIIRKENRDRIKEILFDLGVIFATMLFTVTPYIVNVLKYGGNSNVAARSAKDIETYGMKLGQLLLPVNNHRISALANLKEKYNALPLSSENSMATLGLLFSIAFIILLIELIKNKHADEDIYICSLLNFGALLLSTIGGFASIIALFFTKIRCYNRLSIFIAFLCAITFAKFIDKYLIRLKKQIWYWGGCALLLGVGLFDQTTASFAPKYDVIIAKWDNNKEFVKRIEELEEPGSQIYQMPYMTYPESGNINDMAGYDQATGYLQSDTLVWSYGCYTGRKGDLWNQYLSVLPLEKQVENIYLNGFDGIYVDSYGYEDEEFEELFGELMNITNAKPILSDNKRLYYYTLANYPATVVRESDYLLAQTFYGFDEGFYAIEKNGTDNWVWSSGNGTLTIYNETDKAIVVQAAADICTMETEGKYTLSVNVNGTTTDFAISAGKSNPIRFDIVLESGENVVEFRSDIPSVKLATDTRMLSFYVKNFSYGYLRELAESSKESFDCRLGGDLSELNIVQGLSAAEKNYTWTDGDCLEMNCNFAASKSLHGIIEVPQVFNEQQKIVVVVDGVKVFAKVVKNNENIEFDFVSNSEGMTNIQILMPDAISPSALGIANDERKLGLAIKSISFEPIDISAEDMAINNLFARTFHEFGEGFYGIERNQTDYWVWSSGSGSISIYNEADEQIPVYVSADVSTLENEGEYKLSIDAEGTPIDFAITAGNRNSISFGMVLKPGENVIELKSDIPVAQSKVDTRDVAFSLVNFSYRYLREIAETSKESFDFRIGGDLSELNIARGLSVAEDNYTWTDGDCLEMNCYLGENKALHGTIEVPMVFNEQQKIAVVVDGIKVFEEVVLENGRIEFDFVSNSNGLTNIQILMPDAGSPLSLGIANDARRLGLAISSIRFEPIDISPSVSGGR